MCGNASRKEGNGITARSVRCFDIFCIVFLFAWEYYFISCLRPVISQFIHSVDGFDSPWQ